MDVSEEAEGEEADSSNLQQLSELKICYLATENPSLCCDHRLQKQANLHSPAKLKHV